MILTVKYIPPPNTPDPACIPRGQFCYDTEHVPANPQTGEREYWIQHFDRRCPYWRRTDHATVCCDFLRVEHLDEKENNIHASIEAHFGSEEEAKNRVGRSLLYDEFKICGINDE
jgi:hypothetical protein